MFKQKIPTSGEVFSLLAALCLCMTWALSSATLNLPDFCQAKPILLCASSNYGDVHPWLTALLIAGMLGVYLVMQTAWSAGYYTLIYAVVVGIVNRLLRDAMLFVSDVIDATREALGVLASGHNPYLHTFLTTRPPYSPFPYLPGELLLYGIPYALFGTIDRVDRWIGIATLFLIAALAPIVGVGRAALCVALFGTFMLAAATAVDGTNDGGLALLLIASVVLLAWSEAALTRLRSRKLWAVCYYGSAVFFAWALLYKAFSWPFFPFIIAYLMGKDRVCAWRYMLTVGSLSLLAVIPFLFPSPGGFFSNVYQGFVFHEYLYGLNLWTALRNAGVSIDSRWRFITSAECAAAVGILIALLGREIRSLGEALMCGLAVIMAALLLAHFSTSSYYTSLGTIFIAALALVQLPGRVASSEDA